MDDNGAGVREAIVAARSAVDTLTGWAPWQACDADVAALVVQTETLVRVLSGVQLAAVAEGVTRGLPFAAGAGTGRSAPGRWVRSLIPVTPGDAARRADLSAALFTGHRDGTTLTELAPTRDALLAGGISTGHAEHVVDAVCRLLPPHTPTGVVDEATRAEAQALLLSVASGGTGPDGTVHAPVDPTQLAKAATALTATLDPGYGDRLARDEDAQHAQRAFAVTPLPTGMCRAVGLLTNEVGHALIGVLHALSAPRPAADGTPDPRTARMRTHDGLGAAVRHLQAARPPGGGLLPGVHGSPHRLVVSVDVHTLAAHLGLRVPGKHLPGPHPPGADPLAQGPLAPAQLPGRWPLSPLGAQVIACDADLVAVLIGPDGTPLDVADTVYPFSTRQRTAIIDRDRHCTYGTCTAPPPWCQVHHLTPHSRGGPTTVPNGALLCGVHHRHVHASHLTGTRTEGGTVVWQAATGTNPDHPPPAVTAAITALAARWHRRQRGRAAAPDDTG